MLRLARHLHRETGLDEPLPGRRRRAQLRGATAGSCEKGPSRSSGSSPRPATPAARWASRSPPGTRLDGQPAARPAPRRMRGAYLGPAFTDAEIERVPRQAARRPYARAAPTRTCSSGSPTTLAGGQGRRLVPGPDGVRAAGARRPQHPRRRRGTRRCSRYMNLKIKFRECFRPFAPSVLADERVAECFEIDCRQPLHAARRPGPRGAAHAADRRAARPVGHRPAERAALGHPRRHPRRLLGAHPDRRRDDEPALLRPHPGVRGA